MARILIMLISGLFCGSIPAKVPNEKSFECDVTQKKQEEIMTQDKQPQVLKRILANGMTVLVDCSPY